MRHSHFRVDVSVREWTVDELDELAVAEYDPRYLPPSMRRDLSQELSETGMTRCLSTRITPLRIRLR